MAREEPTYTRRGKGGVAQVEVDGLIAAAFTHRDSRAGDPDLHTHVAVSNKVRAKDGQWLALDGRPFFKNNVAASELYNIRLEALLIERLGVSLADRAGTDPSKRPIREIVGVDGALPRHWSKRRASIDVRAAPPVTGCFRPLSVVSPADDAGSGSDLDDDVGAAATSSDDVDVDVDVDVVDAHAHPFFGSRAM